MCSAGVRVLILDDAEDLIAKQLVDQAVKICNALELRVVEKVRHHFCNFFSVL